MADFVLEIRPRSIVYQAPLPTYSPHDFVAEIRPRTYNNNPEPRQESRQCSPPDISDSYVQDMLTDRHFSRESITKLLESSILKLVEKLLTGRPISKIEGRLHIFLSNESTPLTVNLSQVTRVIHGNNDYLTDQTLENNLNFKVKDKDMMHSICSQSLACSPLHELDRDYCSAASEADGQQRFLCGVTREGDHSMPSPPSDSGFCSATPPPLQKNPAQHQEVESPESKLEKQRRRESDEESGYTSSEKEDQDTSGEQGLRKTVNPFNDYYCSGFDGKSTIYTSDETKEEYFTTKRKSNSSHGSTEDDSIEMDDYDNEDFTELDNSLVIDENPVQNLIVASVQEPDRKNNKNIRSKEYIPPHKTAGRGFAHTSINRTEAPLLCEVDEMEDTDYPVSSDITDIDSPMDLSGDGRFTSDLESVPQPLSLVAKHHLGFKCTRCSHVLADTADMSIHVQTTHNLYCCIDCCRTFTAKNNLKRHMRLHTGLRPYKCTQCPQSFTRRDDLKGHMLRHDYSKPFRCSLCKKGYTDRACVKNHMAKEHRSRLMHVCPQCGESFDQDEAFAAHKKSHPELLQFSCKTCSFIGTNNLMTLKHNLLHSHKLFSCKPCNAYFADPFDYTNHVRKHKKMPTFSQYICCFCEVCLSTYDQYVRHEYSHAQGKSHACKTCKKQFRSKSLLLEHNVTHEAPNNTPLTESKDPESAPIVMPQNSGPHANEFEHKIFFGTGREHGFSNDHSKLSSRESCVSKSIDLSYESFDDNSFYLPEGQLLDLSVKKVSSSTSSSYTSPKDQGNLSTRPRESGPVELCCPRNGVVCSESRDARRELEVYSGKLNQITECENRDDKTHGTHFSTERNRSDCNRVSPNKSQVSRALTRNEAQDSLHLLPGYPQRPPSGKNIYLHNETYDAMAQRRQLHRSTSQDSRQTLLRFSPYNREKMADLAAKFVAARGTELFGSRIPLKSLSPKSENRDLIMLQMDAQKREGHMKQSPPLPISNWRLASSIKSKESFGQTNVSLSPESAGQKNALLVQSMDKNMVNREDSNPETALKCHIPTFVKSENLSDLDVDMKSGSGGCDDARMDDTNSEVSSFVCEICKETFRSFLELENHSAESHKRYLCKHCMKSFTASPNRDRHVRYHTGERPYKCDLCDLAFFRGDDLKYHRTTRHPTAQPFTCTRCSATFTWCRDLERHIRHSKCVT